MPRKRAAARSVAAAVLLAGAGLLSSVADLAAPRGGGARAEEADRPSAAAEVKPRAAAAGSAVPAGSAGTAEPPEAIAEGGEGRGGSPSPFYFGTRAFENADAEARLDSLRVTYGDGLPPESVPVRRTPDGPCLTLGDMGRIGGGGFLWNPQTWRGSFMVDTVEVGLTLDSPIFWVAGSPVQLPGPVRYREENVLLPIGLIDAVIAPILGQRCEWNPLTGRLALAPRPPWLTTLALRGSEFAADLQLGPIAAGDLRLRWDPIGVLHVEGKGARPEPGAMLNAGRVEGIQILRVAAAARGFEVALRCDPRWTGVRLREDRGTRLVHVELTARDREVYRGKYQPLASWPAPREPRRSGGGPGRTILIEVAPPPASAGLAGDCLGGLAAILSRTLEQEFGHTVIPVEDRGESSTYRSPAGLPETPGVPQGSCWIGLRLETRSPGAAGEFGLVTARPAPRRAPLSLGSLARSAEAVPEAPAEAEPAPEGFEEIPPWGQVARLEQAASARLARIIADHLDYRWADRPVRLHERPSRIFRGLGLPAVLVYPAAANDELALAALCDSVQAGELARNIAFAIDEFLLMRAGEE